MTPRQETAANEMMNYILGSEEEDFEDQVLEHDGDLAMLAHHIYYEALVYLHGQKKADAEVRKIAKKVQVTD